MLVVADVIEIRCPRIVVERDQIAVGVETAADLEHERRPLGVPGGLFVPHPLHAHGPSNFLRQICRLEPGIVCGGAAVRLRPFHPDDAHLFAGIPRNSATPVRIPYNFMSFE